MDRALRRSPAISPQTLPHVGMVLHCEGPVPGLEEVAAHVAQRLPTVPALRSTPAGSRWSIAESLDISSHVEERTLAPGSLDAAVGELIGAPLPEPAWRLHLLHGHAPDGFALLFRVHHSLQDGGGILHTLEALFSEEAPASAAYPGFARPQRITIRDLATSVRLLLGGTVRRGAWTAHPEGFSGSREHRWRTVPLDLLRSAAGRHSASVNDVFLAALAHALVRTGERPPSTPAAVPFLVPVNLRRPGEEAAPGNRVILTSLALPGGERTAAQRLSLTAQATGALRSASLRAALRRITDLTPVPVLAAVRRSVTSPAHAAMLASNVAVGRPLAFRGARVTGAAPVMWAPLGIPAAAVLTTYGDTATAGFVTDPAMPGLDGLPDLWREAVETLA
ncbi:Uncharacterized protein, contains a NRPS condensation (elongation) domain [Glycomyces sambucus]|uniref:diacylglycerol O-acyltransferase n=2 Tax=Glycomyces sambucus TaxID=380244 RepID=A0A1G9I7L1_9ACTN|nr:Uncharacterized protein, contains a NRPS condensation (elongation) domain [Glycomyces sambucus]